jgi:hypothetical protein
MGLPVAASLHERIPQVVGWRPDEGGNAGGDVAHDILKFISMRSMGAGQKKIRK